nr:hypothetical protein Iba_scaffold2471.2CG0130 [Ipomoea batatas]
MSPRYLLYMGFVVIIATIFPAFTLIDFRNRILKSLPNRGLVLRTCEHRHCNGSLKCWFRRRSTRRVKCRHNVILASNYFSLSPQLSRVVICQVGS